MSFSEWKIYKLGDLITYKKGFAFKSKDIVQHGHPVIRVTNFTNDSIDISRCIFINEKELERHSEYQIFFNDIIIATVGSWPNNPNSIVGKVISVPKNANGALLNQNAVILKVKPEHNNRFIFYKLRSKDFSDHLLAGARGSANQASISLEDIFKYKFKLPNIDIQQRIASILSSLDDKIELNRQTNKTLETIAQTLFKEMCLPKGEELPEGWKVGRLKDFIEINPKLSLKKNNYAKYVEMKDLSEDSAIVKRFLDREFSSGSKFQNGDTLLARITPCLENGKTGLVDFLQAGEIGWGSTEFIILRGKSHVGAHFVYCLSRLQSFREFAIQSMVGSSGRQRVVDSILAEYELIIPTDDILKKFNNLAEVLFKQIFSNYNETLTLTTLRDSLLPKLMKGEIAV